jgi:lipopolysaccharide transport system ATP-binding protein
MANDIVIRAEHVSKQYRLGVINHGTLYRDLQSWWARLRGRPDPNAEIKDLAGHRVSHARIEGDRFHALDDVSFEIGRGEIVGVIGRNGAGKSTLLKVISRITAPTSGYIGLKGRVASLLEVGTGFHPELTGRENVYLNGAILGMSRREVAGKFEQIVEFAEIGEFIDTPVKRYSSGMYVRLAFSVAAHLEPEILLVDEVLAVGDINFQKKCIGRMQEVGRDGRTILFVSHNLTAVSQLCEKTLLINEGMVGAYGETSKVIDEYVNRFSECYAAEYLAGLRGDAGAASVLRVAVCDRLGKVVSQVELSEGFAVEVEYELRESLSGLAVGMQVILDDGLITMISLSDPELAPERLEPRKPGRYRASVQFPGKLLNTGKYRIRVGISSRFSIYDVVENVTFEVEDRVGIVQVIGRKRKNSLLSVQLPWQVALVE